MQNFKLQTRLKRKLCCCALLVCAPFTLVQPVMAGDKIIGTAAVNSIEGSAGGGIMPWAVLSGYAGDDQWAASVVSSHSQVDDFSLNTLGVAVNYHDRVELSYSSMTFGIDAGAPDIKLNVVGAKVKLMGDVIYGSWPQISLGVMHKSLDDFAIAKSVGASKDSGTDVYLSMTKAWLDGPAHRTVVLSANARLSEGNQLGILGFSGDDSSGHKLSFEAAAAVFLNRHWIVGTEYRQKSDHLSALNEDNWVDVFVSYIPNKSLSITAAYLALGTVAGQENQNGFYVSLQGAF